MDSKTFDAIARMLDARLIRRRAARAVVAALLGGAFVGGTRPGAARKRGKGREKATRVRQEAAGPGNSACAHFCNAVFPPGRQRGQCKSEGARQVLGNLWDACEAEVDRFCDGFCCGAGETCDGSICQGACPGTWEQCEGADRPVQTAAPMKSAPPGLAAKPARPRRAARPATAS